MRFIEIPTEQTTAVTDVILALLALGCAIYLYRIGRRYDLRKTKIWTWIFGLLSFSAAFGALAHGFKMSAQTNNLLWQPINLALGLTVALFVVGVVYDLRGYKIARLLMPILLIIGVVFYLITLIIPGSFLVFILYETVAMLFALTVYFWLAARKRLKGAWLMTLGILITIIASGIQASEAVFITFIWEFDFNGVFHIVQMVGLVVLLFGLRSALLSLRKVS